MQAVMSSTPEATEMIESNPVIAFFVGTEKLTTTQLPMINIEDSDVVQFAIDDEQPAFVG